MRTDRLLSILLLLQKGKRTTAGELAARLEVSERTIHRDMEALGAAGVPVVAQRGQGGGWYLLDDYRVELNGLGLSEVRALFLASPRLLDDLGLHEAAREALIKVLAALPERQRKAAEFVGQRIHVDASGWRRPVEDLTALPLLQEALWQERRVGLVYRRGDGTVVDRILDPLGLVAKGSIWYLVAAVDGEPRTYRVSRVVEVRLEEEEAARPAGFELAAYWADSMASFASSLPRYPVSVRARPEVLSELRNAGWYGRVERVGPPAADGRVPIEMCFELEQDACGCLLYFGDRVEVVQPLALREKIIELAGQASAFYAGLSPNSVQRAPQDLDDGVDLVPLDGQGG